MLQNRQLVHLGTAVVQKPFDQLRVNGGSRFFDGFTNNFVQLIAR